MQFSHYINPEKARQIFEENLGDICSGGCDVQAAGIAATCRTAEELDAKLCLLLSGIRRNYGFFPRKIIEDSDGDGSLYSVCAKSCEETREQ
jgi:hypothetical protein